MTFKWECGGEFCDLVTSSEAALFTVTAAQLLPWVESQLGIDLPLLLSG